MTTTPKPHYYGHRKRLREKLAADSSILADYEILELLLGLVLTRADTKPLAKELLKRFDTFRGVLDAPHAELLQVPGFGEALKTFWILIHECKARYVESPMRRRFIMTSPELVATMAQQRLAGLAHEELWAALVDSQNRLIAWTRILKGSLDSISITPRSVLAPAYEYKASGIFLAHNHPGGSLSPSKSDIEMTAQLHSAASLMEIRFVDHFIIADGKWLSMREQGLFPV